MNMLQYRRTKALRTGLIALRDRQFQLKNEFLDLKKDMTQLSTEAIVELDRSVNQINIKFLNFTQNIKQYLLSLKHFIYITRIQNKCN